MFCTNCSKICPSFARNKIFEKSKMAARPRWRTYCEIHNYNWIVVIENNKLTQSCFRAKA